MIEQTPNITYIETDQNPKFNGEGAVIPLVIGHTGNNIDADNITIKKYKNISSIESSVSNGGIGNSDSNMSYQFFKGFTDETNKIYSNDTGIPYVYFIDMGSIPFTNGDAWTNAFNLAMTKRDIGKLVLVGFTKSDTSKAITDTELKTIVGILASAEAVVIEDSKKGKPKRIMFTVDGATDEDMIKITSDESKAFIQKSRVIPCVPDHFGKIVARYCLTKYDIEPGYEDFRSITEDDVIERTPDIEEDLQNAGINFVRKEMEGSNVHAKICLGVSSSMAATTRPNDCVPHYRRNVDHLINRIYTACYPQLKRNETKATIDMLQTDVNNIVEEEIEAGSMQEGTEVVVEESDLNPVQLQLKGYAKPVNSTEYIGIEMYISAPDILVVNNTI